MVALGILVPSVSVRIAAVQQKRLLYGVFFVEQLLTVTLTPPPSPRERGWRQKPPGLLIRATSYTKNTKNVLVTALPWPEEDGGGKEEEEEHGYAAHYVSVTHKEGFSVQKLDFT